MKWLSPFLMAFSFFRKIHGLNYKEFEFYEEQFDKTV